LFLQSRNVMKNTGSAVSAERITFSQKITAKFFPNVAKSKNSRLAYPFG